MLEASPAARLSQKSQLGPSQGRHSPLSGQGGHLFAERSSQRKPSMTTGLLTGRAMASATESALARSAGSAWDGLVELASRGSATGACEHAKTRGRAIHQRMQT